MLTQPGIVAADVLYPLMELRLQRIPRPVSSQAGKVEGASTLRSGRAGSRVFSTDKGTGETVQDPQLIRLPSRPELLPADSQNEVPYPRRYTIPFLGLETTGALKRPSAGASCGGNGRVPTGCQRPGEPLHGLNVLHAPRPVLAHPAPISGSGIDASGQCPLGQQAVESCVRQRANTVADRRTAVWIHITGDSQAETVDDADFLRGESRPARNRNVTFCPGNGCDMGMNGLKLVMYSNPGPLARAHVSACGRPSIRVLAANQARGAAVESSGLLVGEEVLPPRKAEIVCTAQHLPGYSRVGSRGFRRDLPKLALAFGHRVFHVPIPTLDNRMSETVDDPTFLRRPDMESGSRCGHLSSLLYRLPQAVPSKT